MTRRPTLLSTTVLLALLALLVVGLLAPAAFAASKYRPVVKAVSPATCAESGGATITVTGKYFKLDGKRVVTGVTIGGVAATHVRVKSAKKLTMVAPAGKGRPHVRVATSMGRSARSEADRLIYLAPATQVSLNAGDAQTASAGAQVAVKPSVLVRDRHNATVPGVHVTFAVASGGGTVTSADAVSDSQGVATVGSWKLGPTPGANTLTATCEGLAGSPVTFTATGDAGILTVQQAGTPVRSYSLAELQALTPFAGFAGVNKTTVLGPDAVTGAKVTDIVADALGAALAATQSVEITNWVPSPGTPYTRTYTRDQLVNLAGSATFTYADATTKDLMVPVGTLAAILIYSDPAARVMPVANGPLRFAVATSVSENMAYGPSSSSVSTVNVLNVITTP
jgi:hypothetical protein